jgi:hypothetical protein
MDEPMAGVAKHLKGFPWRYGVGRAGSTAVKRSLFTCVEGRNQWLSIQIDSDRKFESTPRFRGTGDTWKIFYENSLPSHDPRGSKCP